LWIEWKKGGDSRGGTEGKIAVRKGLGRVFKSFWDAQDPEVIDVRLG